MTQLQPVVFRENSWGRLVLDSEYKDIVQAMVSSYVDKTATLDDLVAGKGKGLVGLLHGPPGSGKTLTAGTTLQNSASFLLSRLKAKLTDLQNAWLRASRSPFTISAVAILERARRDLKSHLKRSLIMP